MEVEIISREIIRPAAFQRDHHQHQKTFQLSLLDTFAPEIYTPTILFYRTKKDQSSNNAHFSKEETISSLKLSLSKTLALFPMLAGRIKGNFIHCSSSDEAENGALFLEATVKASMADFLKTPNIEFLANFVPFPDIVLNQPLETAVQVAAQVNFFSCGTGIAIGLSFLHKIIDGTTRCGFIKSWAASNEGTLEKLACGSYEASSFFPPREISSESPFLVAQGKNYSTRRFVFDAMAVSNLKLRAKSQSVSNPTTVEAVTCFIWKYAMKAASTSKSSDKKEVVGNGKEASCVDTKWRSVLSHAVNMRRRIQPPLSEHEVGNIFWMSQAYYEASNADTNLADLETILRQSILEIANDFIPKAIGDAGFETILSSLQQLRESYANGRESFIFSSWCNLGLNTVNFGWDKPIWIAIGGKASELMMKNAVVLMDRAPGEGIEAWIVLDEETMNLLENDYEFLEFASPNPSITLA